MKQARNVFRPGSERPGSSGLSNAIPVSLMSDTPNAETDWKESLLRERDRRIAYFGGKRPCPLRQLRGILALAETAVSSRSDRAAFGRTLEGRAPDGRRHATQ